MASHRITVVIAARTCPYRQIVSVLPQLSPEDRLVVVLAPELSNADCCNCRNIERSVVTYVNASLSVGPGSARNIGVRAIEGLGKALLFCDADDCVGPTWLSELARPILDDSADLAGGVLRVRSWSGVRKAVLPRIDYWHRLALFGSNMGITYKAWCMLGGFDESLICCEDTDLVWRASDMGLRMQVVPSAVVDYNLRPPLQEFRQRFLWGKSSVQLLRKHKIPLDHLPRLKMLFFDKSSSGFAANPLSAALGHWTGQWWESHRRPDRKQGRRDIKCQ